MLDAVDCELARVIAVWPKLSSDLRAQIIAMIEPAG
jgi:hypothetical protein